MSQVVVRFAPSPTGFLHIGSARTALFNYLFARHHNGRFLLRIEDTDRARSTEAATVALIEGLKWMGLDWEGEPISQFARAARHAEVAYDLLASGKAYKCYATAEELQAFREAHPNEKFQSPWRDRTDGPADQSYAIRIKAPKYGDTKVDGTLVDEETIMVVSDEVQGIVKVPVAELDDFIILRSDGIPTYLLAVVVDDHDMGITHVIRGDDHLTNTFRQNLIYYAMEWAVPVYAHVPLIHGPDGAKLSKRHGALGVGEYEKMGFLPEAMCNYLLRLGWSHGDEEIISRTQAIEWFKDLSAINKAPGRLDFKKMEAVNAHYIKEADDARLVDLVMDEVKNRGSLAIDETLARTRLLVGMSDLKQRFKTILQIADGAHFYLKNDPIDFDDAASEILKNSTKTLKELENTLSDLSGWNSAAIEEACKELAALSYDNKLADVMKPLRGALSGRTNSPSLPHIMEALGKDETLARIRTAQTL